jgi:hypothetical protein
MTHTAIRLAGSYRIRSAGIPASTYACACRMSHVACGDARGRAVLITVT